MTMGRGMNFTADPMPVTPSTINKTPAIMVQRKRPSTPCTAMMPAMTTTKAPVGPPIWVFDPPKRRNQESRDHGAINSRLRRQPDAMAKAIASGNATRPTVIPATKSSRNLLRCIRAG